MSANLTGRAQSSLGAVAIATDGDDWSSHTGTTPYLGSFQEMLDRMSLGAVSALLIRTGAHDFVVDAGGSPSSFTVRVSGVVAQIQDGSGIYRAHYSLGEMTAGAAQIEGGGSLAADTWYHAYLTSPGTLSAAPVLVISTLGPAANRLHRVDSVRYIYVGTLRTDGSGNPLPLRIVRGRALYRDQTIALHLNQSTANLSTWSSALSLADRVPSHARRVLLRARANRVGTTGTISFAVRANGDTNPAYSDMIPGAILLEFPERAFEMDVDASREVQIATAANCAVSIDVGGWSE